MGFFMTYFRPMGSRGKISVAIILIFSLNPAFGQTNLIIDDLTNEGFFLGINGYLQNAEKKSSIVIRDLDTVPYYLQIDSDTFHFTKKIHLREAQNYHFVLVRNFHGVLKLRYRGMATTLPKGTKSQIVDQTIEWPREWKHIPVNPDSSMIAAADKQVMESKVEEMEMKAPALVDSSKVMYLDEIKEDLEPVAQLPESNGESFQSFLEKLRSEQYEFEKLSSSINRADNHPLKIEEMAQIAEALTYDQTRLQFFEKAKNYIRDQDDIRLLGATLEYELSKKQLEKMLLNE